MPSLAVPALLTLPVERTTHSKWILVEEGFTLAREHEIESVFAVSNGYLGTRGSLAEGSSLSAPATFLNGVFETYPDTRIPELAIALDWTRLSVHLNGHELALENGSIVEHRRILDMRQGLLWREWTHRDPSGRISKIVGLRLVSLAERHLGVQAIVFSPENYSGTVRLMAGLDRLPAIDRSVPEGPLEETASPTAEHNKSSAMTMSFRTADEKISVAFSAATRLSPEDMQVSREVESGSDHVMELVTANVEIGKTYRIDRLVSVYSSRDVDRPVERATAHVGDAGVKGLNSIITAHVKAWESRWKDADVEIEGDDAAQRVIRFACYHLISAANPEDEHASIGARALTGDAYKGHVFWDTEIYMLPFFIFTQPAAARALLMYRYHTLSAARRKAQAFGFHGAMYPWESADTGDDVTPPFIFGQNGEIMQVRNAEEEIHVSADISFAVWLYWQATCDEEFFREYGAEIIIETARFWASRAKVEADRLYHIRRVIGPDEYHEDVDDNVYTNLMAKWNLDTAANVAQIFQERWPEHWSELVERLSISSDEQQHWQQLARGMYTDFDRGSGLLEQFRGYFDLKEIDLKAFEPRTVAMDVLLGRERISQSNVIKQPDVVMALYLLWEHNSSVDRDANFRYYESRTGHGSSLSPAIYALVAARLGYVDLAERYFRQAAEIDLADNMGNASGGVHVGSLGGLWQAVIFGFAGLQLRPDGLSIDPKLPTSWRKLQFPFQWRERKLRITISREPFSIEVEVNGSAGLSVAAADGVSIIINPGQRYRILRNGHGWKQWKEVRT